MGLHALVCWYMDMPPKFALRPLVYYTFTGHIKTAGRWPGKKYWQSFKIRWNPRHLFRFWKTNPSRTRRAKINSWEKTERRTRWKNSWNSISRNFFQTTTKRETHSPTRILSTSRRRIWSRRIQRIFSHQSIWRYLSFWFYIILPFYTSITCSKSHFTFKITH